MGVLHVLLAPGHPDLRPLLAGLGAGFTVEAPQAGGRVPDGRQAVALVAALGLTAEQARARVEAAAGRHGVPAIGVVDLPLGGAVGPGNLLPHAGLTAGALARALILARSRAGGRVAGDIGTGVACDATLRALSRRLAGAAQDLSHLRRLVMGDPRAARHAEGLAWSLRAIDTAITATLEDPAGGQPIPVHALPGIALPLLEAALGPGIRIEFDTTTAPLGLVPPTAIELLIHAASDAQAAAPGEGSHPRLAISVQDVPGTPACARLRLRSEPGHEEIAILHQATTAAALQCGARLSGTTGEVLIELPLSASADDDTPGVLVVDDHLEVATVVADVLRGADLAVAVVGTAEQALDHLARHPATRLVVSDVALPGLDGVDLADRLAAARCPARVLLITGFAEDRPLAAQRSGLVRGVLHKPFAPDALLAAVHAALD